MTLVLSATPALTKEIVEVNRKFVWKPVPGTLYSSEIGNPHSEMDLHYINTDNVIRRKNLVVFEVVTPDASYLRLEGNCQTKKMRELYVGSFELENKLTYIQVDHPWLKVNKLHQKLLNFACNIK